MPPSESSSSLSPHRDDARHAAEVAVRDSYGRLVAILARRWGDPAGAEDALSEALQSALVVWPDQGVPQKPEAWLLTVAHRRLLDAARSRSVRAQHLENVSDMISDHLRQASSGRDLPDERLPLLFVCAHPAIAPEIRTPLMLQLVLGFDAARIAAVFLVEPATMGQRLVRAKTKIREARIGFRIPEPAEWPDRLSAVLEAVYAAYSTGWENPTNGSDQVSLDFRAEAIRLGRILIQQLPNDPEVAGLLALMLHCDARHGARVDRNGRYVPLDQQEVSEWRTALIEEAETLLRQASRVGRLGRFQVEAAIQSVHAARLHTGKTDHAALVTLYSALLELAPTVGAHIARAAALVKSGNPHEALRALDRLSDPRTENYQPYWAVKAHALAAAGRADEATAARTRALALTSDPAVREYLIQSL